MARHAVGAAIGIPMAAGASLSGFEKFIPLSSYKETAALTNVSIALAAAAGGPIWAWAYLVTGRKGYGLGDPAWISADVLFNTDYFSWEGDIVLEDQGGNELIPLFRNNTLAAVTVNVTWRITLGA